MVESVNGGTVHTIEGNKGDEVRRGSYSVNSPSIIGYGRPRYELIDGKVTAEDMPLVKKGSKDDAVKKLQQILNAKGYKLTEDSDFGPATEAAVRAFQKANHLETDGEVGPLTWAALLK
jgi:murein L,D-transpeptidase YcbB/YkuD